MTKMPVARLQWLCRRGTKELDALYGWWLEHRYADANPEQRQAFAELLQEQDPDLWDWTIARDTPPRADWQEIVLEIRASHHL